MIFIDKLCKIQKEKGEKQNKTIRKTKNIKNPKKKENESINDLKQNKLS